MGDFGGRVPKRTLSRHLLQRSDQMAEIIVKMRMANLDSLKAGKLSQFFGQAARIRHRRTFHQDGNDVASSAREHLKLAPDQIFRQGKPRPVLGVGYRGPLWTNENNDSITRFDTHTDGVLEVRAWLDGNNVQENMSR